jgi:hypothetical protein
MTALRVVVAARLRIAACCLSLAALAVVERSAAAQSTEPASVADANLVQWVSRRAAAWQPTTDERRFDQIGWATDIRDAERLARKHQRPIFLFTYDGRSIALKRC